ncbi:MULTISPECIES: FecR domain-containing protein [unclassified Duganella]|uniref:FecR family protein n=1 Tax=unclassified Duganella TaxID=2636909 RepID=UPI0006FFBAC1|nr:MULTISPECIES: FecR family protein [unclassified Duganella]KQV54431.1 iron dicitrate transport regulator FecR [Duganella sp. Root336D2]KRC03557.1 iron dicitrate transport regulator FecR [Duganella sp. Root198D2]
MKPLQKCTATKLAGHGLVLASLWLAAALALAAPVAGTVIQLNGPLMARKADGTAKVLSIKSEVENGDTLVTEKSTYALVRFIDNSEITLRPGSTLTIENFSFDSGKQEADRAQFNLVKGGLRSVSGLLGKRSKEKFELKTPAATIGIRGTLFVAEIVAPAGKLPAAQAPRAPGLYVQVLDGMIHLNNGGGSLSFNAGQFGFTPGAALPPVVLPQNPGMQFNPPPIFNTAVPGGKTTASNQAPRAVDCEVR